jgi:hypothetical protein
VILDGLFSLSLIERRQIAVAIDGNAKDGAGNVVSRFFEITQVAFGHRAGLGRLRVPVGKEGRVEFDHVNVELFDGHAGKVD